MPRLIPLLAGLLVATGVTYEFRNHMISNQNNIKQGVESAKSTIDRATTTEPHIRPSSYISDSQRYVKDRLVPSVKETWNTQVMNAAQYAVKADIGSKMGALWEDKVVNNVKEMINRK
ncbi:hypothetical protein BDB01DRAFT_831815 [Pilobolus umbonatus]|nr:hypothetical protein BDB01DRAFT_831815 [Pilobolus umbonatus]